MLRKKSRVNLYVQNILQQSLPYWWFHFLRFQLPIVNCSQKYYMENSKDKNECFKLHIILSRVMKSYAVLLYPTQGGNSPIVQLLHAIYAFSPFSHLVALWVTSSTVPVLQCFSSGNSYLLNNLLFISLHLIMQTLYLLTSQERRV